jgi:hypothetical protein
MIGKILGCAVLGGTTLAIYMVVFDNPEPYPIAPPLKPIPPVTVTVTPTTTQAPGGVNLQIPLPSVVPDPTVGGMLCPRTSTKTDGTCTLQDWGLPSDPPTPTPTFVPAHPGEEIV